MEPVRYNDDFSYFTSTLYLAYGIAWIGIVVFDTEILILTAWKTFNIFRVRRTLGMVGTVGERIAYVFLRDGKKRPYLPY